MLINHKAGGGRLFSIKTICMAIVLNFFLCGHIIIVQTCSSSSTNCEWHNFPNSGIRLSSDYSEIGKLERNPQRWSEKSPIVKSMVSQSLLRLKYLRVDFFSDLESIHFWRHLGSTHESTFCLWINWPLVAITHTVNIFDLQFRGKAIRLEPN